MNFYFALSAVVMAFAVVAMASNDIPGELIRAAKMRPAPIDDECQGRVRHCSNCTHLVTCLPSGDNSGFSIVSNDACPSTAPYCVNDTCATFTEDETCAAESPSTFKCAKGVEGYLPDPKNCQMYHFCHDGKASDFRCSDMNHMYNHKAAMCTMDGKSSKWEKGSDMKCPIIDCTGKALTFVTYPADAQVYALCQSDETPLLAKCDEHFQFNVTTTACERVCTEEGRQGDAKDSAKYFECVLTGGKKESSQFTVVAGRCPEGTKFDQKTERCKA